MNQRQESKIAMHNTVINLLLEHTDLWQNITAFAETIRSYQDKHDFISEVIKEKARKLAGVNNGKRNMKLNLATIAQKNAGLLRAFAAKTGNEVLQAEMTFTRTELRNLSDNKLGPVARNIYDHVVTNKDDLAKYNVTGESIIAFEKLINEFKTTSSSTHKAIMGRKTLGMRLSTLLAELDTLLDNQLDQVMLDYEGSQPEFYQLYHNCRLLVDPRTSPTQFAGNITDATTGAALKNVMITVNGTSYLANARLDGSYKLPVPKPGAYTVSFELNGYEVTEAEGELKLGRTTEMNVVMKKSL